MSAVFRSPASFTIEAEFGSRRAEVTTDSPYRLASSNRAVTTASSNRLDASSFNVLMVAASTRGRLSSSFQLSKNVFASSTSYSRTLTSIALRNVESFRPSTAGVRASFNKT